MSAHTSRRRSCRGGRAPPSRPRPCREAAGPGTRARPHWGPGAARGRRAPLRARARECAHAAAYCPRAVVVLGAAFASTGIPEKPEASCKRSRWTMHCFSESHQNQLSPSFYRQNKLSVGISEEFTSVPIQLSQVTSVSLGEKDSPLSLHPQFIADHSKIANLSLRAFHDFSP